MDSPVFKFIDKSKYCKNLDDLSGLVHEILSNLGFERWGYETDPVNPFEESAPVFLHTFPEEWVSHYMENSYYKIDPVMTTGKSKILPFQWSKLTEGIEVDKSVDEFNNQASEFGLNEGMGIPIPRVDGKKSIFTITGNKDSKEIGELIKHNHEQLIAIACAFHSIATDMLREGRHEQRENPLTKREQECILWVARGKTAWETSKILNVSERTINFHIENAKVKLGASNRYHLVVACVMKMYIRP